MPGRSDIDFVTAPSAEQLPVLRQTLPESEFSTTMRSMLRHQRQSNVIEMHSGWKADLIIRKSRPFSQTEFAGRFQTQTAVIPVLFELQWSRALNYSGNLGLT